MQTLIKEFRIEEETMLEQRALARQNLFPFESSGDLAADHERIAALHRALYHYSTALLDSLCTYATMAWDIRVFVDHGVSSEELLELRTHVVSEYQKTLQLVKVVDPQVDAAFRLNKACVLMKGFLPNRAERNAQMASMLGLDEHIEMQLCMAIEDLDRAGIQDYGFINSQVLSSFRAHYNVLIGIDQEPSHQDSRVARRSNRSTSGS